MARLQTKKNSSSREAKRKIAPEDVRVGVGPDEIGQILNLKKNLDYSDVLTKFACRYLQMGWELVAVNPKGTAELDLDFRQPQDVWSQKLAKLGLEGIQVNVGVRTGASANLMVLEVKSSAQEFSSGLQGEWRSGCVAQVGIGWEQHYYVLPKGWAPPPSCYLDSHRLMVFGCNGLVLAPPSVEPRAQESLRWLRPPWESPPSRPSPRLLQFLTENIPAAAIPSLEPEPERPLPSLPDWDEIYGQVSAYPAVLQALLAPAGGGEEYYRQVLEAAREAGIGDPQVLLALLWHAPLGEARNRPQGRQELQDLINATLNTGGELPLLERLTTLMEELRSTFAALSTAEGRPISGCLPPATISVGPPAAGRTLEETARSRQEPREFAVKREQTQAASQNLKEQSDTIFWVSHENILVQRERYEAMLYELGKLGAWHEVQKLYFRENKSLREKLESQQQKEVLHLRRLCSQKKGKGWWR